MSYSRNPFRRNAFHRTDALVAGVACLLALVMAAGAGKRIKQISRIDICTDHLRRLGEISVMVANADARGIRHRQASSGQNNWIGLGAWDWGGANGIADYSYDSTISFYLGASKRPYNMWTAGGGISDVYKCPEDFGIPSEYSAQSSVQYGTSYYGDFLWFSSDNLMSATRFGSFMRPDNMFESPSKTLFLTDAIFMDAALSTEEMVSGGSFPGGIVSDVPSWHGNFKHNVLLADGHTQSIEIKKVGSVINPRTLPARYMVRGTADWRHDTHPQPTISEHFVGNPIVPTGGTDESIMPGAADSSDALVFTSPQFQNDQPDDGGSGEGEDEVLDSVGND